jgi:hypothetical protein
MIIIHLNFKMADDKDKKKKKPTKKKDEPAEEEEEESNKINYFPRLDKVEEFFKGAL